MNVKHVLVFTTYIVLSNGYNDTTEIPWDLDIDEGDRLRYRQALIEHWSTSESKEECCYEDNDGNVFLRLKVKHDKENTFPYVIDAKRIGVKLVTPAKDQDENEELIDLFANLLEVPKNALQVVTGFKSREKTMKLNHGFLAIKVALGKIADACINVKRPY